MKTKTKKKPPKVKSATAAKVTPPAVEKSATEEKPQQGESVPAETQEPYTNPRDTLALAVDNALSVASDWLIKCCDDIGVCKPSFVTLICKCNGMKSVRKTYMANMGFPKPHWLKVEEEGKKHE